MKQTDVTVSREIPAAPADVFDVWLDEKSPGGPWFGAGRVILNPVVDGLFYHSVLHERKEWAHYGRFVRIEKPRVIEHTWMSEATNGIETTVTITLEPNGKDTRITVRHTGLPDEKSRHDHEEGWKFITGALAEGLAAKRK
jgi:uncharacterized protein YndB with AHSA1/START domain